jgi:hypothetical protein
MLVCIADDGGLQDPMKEFHESVSCGMIRGCPRKANAAEFGQGVEVL